MMVDTEAPAFRAWLDRFFTTYYRQRPVNATFVGRHEYDHLLPDLSLAGAAIALAEIESLQRGVGDLPTERLSQYEQLDRRLAGGFLAVAAWEYESGHFLRRNPAVYTGEAIFGVLSLFLRPFAPFSERAAAATARLLAIPTLLGQAREVIEFSPPAWIERGRRECGGAQAFLSGGIDLLTTEDIDGGTRLRDAANVAAAAFVEFDNWLAADLSHRPDDVYACGAEALELLVKRGHFLPQSVSEIERHALKVLAESKGYLEEHARDFGAASPTDVLAQLGGIHPTPEGYYQRYGEVWSAHRETAERLHLLRWPEYPISFVPQPEWARAAAPSLYFLFYRSPAPFDFPLPVEYLVTPIEPAMPVAEQERRLRATNDSVIKLNHVIHHAGIGHHVQNWHAFRSESCIGQIAGVDCASRIAMFAGGTMTEGWACYATELMDEFGFLTPLESYAERHTRLRMAARTVADIRLHQGRWSLGETATFYQEQVGMSPDAAHGEAVKNSMFPGTALMYLAGTDLIHEVRDDLARSQGSAFDLAAFHDRLLSYGSVPVALVADLLLAAESRVPAEGTVNAQ